MKNTGYVKRKAAGIIMIIAILGSTFAFTSCKGESSGEKFTKVMEEYGYTVADGDVTKDQEKELAEPYKVGTNGKGITFTNYELIGEETAELYYEMEKMRFEEEGIIATEIRHSSNDKELSVTYTGFGTDKKVEMVIMDTTVIVSECTEKLDAAMDLDDLGNLRDSDYFKAQEEIREILDELCGDKR